MTQTFENTLDSKCFWTAVFLPPFLYALVVVGLAEATKEGGLPAGVLLALPAIAYTPPLLALLWVLTSACAYTIRPGYLTVHRVLFDRTYPLDRLFQPPEVNGRSVSLKLGRTRLRLKTADAWSCARAINQCSAQYLETNGVR